ncbi:PREDICTED: inter alpha-trypsin inhibitor, heavy chain 4-like [Camelina sativa]|uniref:Inter alpha-trypsin inhibitor, heavy chain 4-like n=1 Tax=Camelina sativa TaxID=90675 RepID=A0ABM0WHT1_CAMSA|nr:PREDICTED: inter alpha-trypsin inhibitor, heavy chain 4-like [Camelina sativa]
MSEEFAIRVEQGLKLSRRIYYGKGITPPLVPADPPSSPDNFLPTAITAYASITDPVAVDNPEVPSYQPYVHARCDPSALVPLQMLGVEMRVDCWLDTAFVSISGRWRVHCVMPSKRFDCCVGVPMGEKGSLLGAEIDVLSNEKSYKTKLVTEDETSDFENVHKDKDSRFFKSHIYTFKIPHVDGGSIFTVNVNWSQKLIYRDGKFHLNVPFRFPAYVVPVGKEIIKREKIELNMNSCVIGGEIACNYTSHPLKVTHREAGKLSCEYEAEVSSWSRTDFSVSFNVSSGDLTGNVLVKSPSPWDSDDRGMFCLYLFPGTTKHKQLFKRRVVFVIDISASMKWKPLEDVKKALLECLAKLQAEDVFNIIAFNDDIMEFSTSMEFATDDTISAVTEWLDSNLIANGGTNMLLPLKQAMKLLEGSNIGVPLVYLVTDGSVENEREICNDMKECCSRKGKSISPRISTFGIGSFCNHYFLRMLARIGNGYYDGTNNTDSFEHQMSRLFDIASSTIVANTTFDALKLLRSVELFPSQVPDITLGDPLILSGRYKGEFPDEIELRGTLADLSCFTIELTVQKAKDIPLDKVLARRQIDELTARAWFEDKKELQEKVMRLSIQTGAPSEYTQMVLSLQQDDEEKTMARPVSIKEILRNPPYQIHKQMQRNNSFRTSLLGKQGYGFGNIVATLKNVPPWMEEPKEADGAELLIRAASGVVDRVCCMCCLQCMSRVSDQCTVVFSQICAALACFQCIGCCFEVCGCLDL